MNTFRSHNKLFLYLINTQKMADHFTYYTLYIQGETTQREPTQMTVDCDALIQESLP